MRLRNSKGGEPKRRVCGTSEYLRGPATLKMRPYLDSAISKLSTMLFLVLCVSTCANCVRVVILCLSVVNKSLSASDEAISLCVL